MVIKTQLDNLQRVGERGALDPSVMSPSNPSRQGSGDCVEEEAEILSGPGRMENTKEMGPSGHNRDQHTSESTETTAACTGPAQVYTTCGFFKFL